MTTEVEVRANHGWPVRVTSIFKAVAGLAETRSVEIVPAGERRSLYAHSHLDLLIQEIQPEEVEDFTKGVKPGVVQSIGVAEGVAIEPVVPRVVTGYIEPITADKLNL